MKIPGSFQWRYDFYFHMWRYHGFHGYFSQPLKFKKVICLIAIIFRIQINATYFLDFSTKIRMCVRSVFYSIVSASKGLLQDIVILIMLKNILLLRCAHYWSIFQHSKINVVSPRDHVIRLYVIATTLEEKNDIFTLCVKHVTSHCTVRILLM